MPRGAEREASEQPPIGDGGVRLPGNRQENGGQPQEDVTLGIGSRSSVVENEREPAARVTLRGLLPTPLDVEAEVARQEAVRR